MTNILSEKQWGSVTLQPLGDGLEQLAINHQRCIARLSLYGGQVLSWQPKGEEEVFWLSNDSLYQQGKAIRGGIPLCWPWFGGYKDAGNHGFARQVNWQVQQIAITESAVNIELVWQGENQHKLWPHKVKVTQTLKFGDSFKQTLTIENLSSSDIEFTSALHSYFNVSHPDKAQVPALNDVEFDCKLTKHKAVNDQLTNLVGPIDRIYYSNSAMEIVDSGLARTIVITPDNVKNWVLWNPGRDTANTMADVHCGGENEYVCLEAANTDWQKLVAGNSVSMGQSIRIARFT